MNRLSEVLERPEPTMAVVFSEPLPDNVIQSVTEIADVAEFRADKFSSHETNYLIEQAKRLAELPLLLTIRIESEGGDWSDSEEERLKLFSDLLPYVDGVDVEIASTLLPEIVGVVDEEDKTIIGSSHDFNTTPLTKTLEGTLAKGYDEGVDYVKIATSAKTLEDFQRLAAFTLSHRSDDLIVVAMDIYGPLSRIVMPALGSHLTYASPGDVAIAPGQLNYLETHDLLSLYPDYMG